MESIAQLLFTVGTFILAVGFAAHIGHAVLLANGRRAAGRARGASPPGRRSGMGGRRERVVRPGADRRRDGPGRRRSPPGVRSPGAAYSLRSSRSPRSPGPCSSARSSWGAGRGATCSSSRVAFTASILGGYLVLSRRYPIRSLGFVPTGVALGLALYASSLPSKVEPLVPALQNAPLLTIHVGMAMLSYGIFATSFAAGVGYLIQGREDRFSWLPSHKVLDEVAYRAVIIGFPIFATMIILGSWWASIAWSRYWGWDPKETAALVTWLIYAIYLHARNQRSWAGRPAAILLVVGFLMVLVTYSGSLWFSGLHAYSGL